MVKMTVRLIRQLIYVLVLAVVLVTSFSAPSYALTNAVSDPIAEIPQANATSHCSGQFTVPANLEAGVPFTNKTNQEISVTFSTEGTWSLGRDYKNVDANGFPSSSLGDFSKGLKYLDKAASSLLAVNSADNQPIQVGAERKITLAPGATFTFLINDLTQPESYYYDNTGSITVKWSVDSNTNVNGQFENAVSDPVGEIPEANATYHCSGQFTVPANLEAGVPFTNKTNQEISVTFSTEGTWSLGRDYKNVDANGFPSSSLGDFSKGLKYLDKAASSLLAVNSANNQPIQVGAERKITLAPGATFTFLINDLTQPESYYYDNTGSITVKWSVDSK